MAYRIEIELIKQSKLIHAMHILNKVTKLLTKFGLGNVVSVQLIETDNYNTLANFSMHSTVADGLEAEHKEIAKQQANNAFRTILGGPEQAQ